MKSGLIILATLYLTSGKLGRELKDKNSTNTSFQLENLYNKTKEYFDQRSAIDRQLIHKNSTLIFQEYETFSSKVEDEKSEVRKCNETLRVLATKLVYQTFERSEKILENVLSALQRNTLNKIQEVLLAANLSLKDVAPAFNSIYELFRQIDTDFHLFLNKTQVDIRVAISKFLSDEKMNLTNKMKKKTNYLFRTFNVFASNISEIQKTCKKDSTNPSKENKRLEKKSTALLTPRKSRTTQVFYQIRRSLIANIYMVTDEDFKDILRVSEAVGKNVDYCYNNSSLCMKQATHLANNATDSCFENPADEYDNQAKKMIFFDCLQSLLDNYYFSIETCYDQLDNCTRCRKKIQCHDSATVASPLSSLPASTDDENKHNLIENKPLSMTISHLYEEIE